MARPIVNHITPFDANIDHEISFSWNGNQAYANRLLIFNADTLAVVYDKKLTSYLLSHRIPAGTLHNGEKWIAQCQTFDMEDIASDLSDKLFFQTLDTPKFYFSNLEDGKTIKAASFEAMIYYLQTDYEEIQSYRFYLYDGIKTLLSESETMYDRSSISYTYKGLDNHTPYFVRCQGITVNGMKIDTGFLSVFTDYKMPSAYGIIYADNDSFHGYVKYHTNIKVIQYNGDNIFNYEDGMIDLRNDSIVYDSGFVIDGDFTLILRGMYLNQTAELLELKNNQYSLRVSSYLYEENELRFKLTVPNGLNHYILYSAPLSIEATDMVSIWIRRIGDLYQLEAIIDPDYSLENDYWYGKQMPPSPQASVYDLWIDGANDDIYQVDKDVMNTHMTDDEPFDEAAAIDDIWI